MEPHIFYYTRIVKALMAQCDRTVFLVLYMKSIHRNTCRRTGSYSVYKVINAIHSFQMPFVSQPGYCKYNPTVLDIGCIELPINQETVVKQ